MASNDLFKHVYQIYGELSCKCNSDVFYSLYLVLPLSADDDGNGSLDAAECNSLFRFLYHTDELSPEIKQILKDVDVNGDGLLSLKSKKRPAILAKQQDIFAVIQEKLLLDSSNNSDASAAKDGTSEVVRKHSSFDPVVDQLDPNASSLRPKASDRLTLKQKQQELKALENWIHENGQQPAIREYLTAFSANFVSGTRLKRLLEKTRPDPDEVKLITELRYSTAVCVKKFDAAKEVLVDLWGIEEQSMVERRHDAVKAMVKGVSAKALLKRTSKQSAALTIGNYLQKKLDEAEEDVHRQVKERWDTLERAATRLARQDLEAFDASYVRQPMGLLFVKGDSDKPTFSSTAGHERTKVVPINAETWTECYDATHGCNYYVSSQGYSTWDRPASCVLRSNERTLE